MREAKEPKSAKVPKFTVAVAKGKKIAAAKIAIPTMSTESLVRTVESCLKQAQSEVEGIRACRGTITLYR